MGYRGKVQERQRARGLRAEAWTLQAIADELASPSSVSVWVRGVVFTPRVVNGKLAHGRAPNKLQRRIGCLSEREFLVAGTALYAEDGSKSDGWAKFTNDDARLVAFFCAWLRRFFEVEEPRLRVHLYLHEGLDISGGGRVDGFDADPRSASGQM